MSTDPICGMSVDESTADLKLVRDNRTFYFCSTSCLEAFAAPEQQLRGLRRRLLVAWPLALLAAALTYAMPFSRWPWVALALAAIVQFYPGLVFYRGLVDAARSRVANMDVLIAVGTSVAFGYSTASLLFPGYAGAAYYFDASALIITLILTGNYLEHLTRRRASSAVRRLAELLPPMVHTVDGGSEADVPLASVSRGISLRVRPGERFAVDGIVRSGTSAVDEAVVSGESLPQEKGPGSTVIAGSVNGEGVLTVEATRVGDDTFLAEVARLLSQAEMSQVPIQRLADRIAERFVPFVLALAILAAVVWSILGAGFTVALLVFVSVVITACPCAFGIATPAAIVVGAGRAAEEGILFRGGDTLERTARVDTVLTDKTGTLTRGEPDLTEVIPATGVSEAGVLALAAGLEVGSEHPFARAVRRAATERHLTAEPVEGVTAVPGHGIQGILGGRKVELVRSAGGISHLGELDEAARGLDAMGRSWSVIRRGEDAIGLLGFFDDLKPGTAEVVRGLRDLGARVVMVTGDNAKAAGVVARPAGIDEVRAGVSPEGKLAIVREFQRAGRVVAFVGDGINDAPALAAADVGIAIGSGTDVAKDAGRILLVRPEFRGVYGAILTARRTVGKVRQNLFWAIGYNSVLLPLAVGVLVPWFGLGIFSVLPITGAVAMGLSSTTVVLNSLSLRRMRLAGPAGSLPSAG
ncbi:MAG: heavy metal translocating P-type ATPase [Thermoplasmata archaeon]